MRSPKAAMATNRCHRRGRELAVRPPSLEGESVGRVLADSPQNGNPIRAVEGRPELSRKPTLTTIIARHIRGIRR